MKREILGFEMEEEDYYKVMEQIFINFRNKEWNALQETEQEEIIRRLIKENENNKNSARKRIKQDTKAKD